MAGSDSLPSSAMKHVDNAVFSTISGIVHSALTSGTVKYDLVQQGERLAPFHETGPSVPQSVRDTLAQVEQGIVQCLPQGAPVRERARPRCGPDELLSAPAANRGGTTPNNPSLACCRGLIRKWLGLCSGD